MAEQAASKAVGPVWEMALSVTTASPLLLDPYRVSEAHDLFREEFPRAERQPPYEGHQLYPTPGARLELAQQITIHAMQSISPSRWWFLTAAGDRLLQLQENFVGVNWRRLAPPPALPHPYPGYTAMRQSFEAVIGKLAEQKVARGESMPPPAVAELLFDNLVPMIDENGDRLTIGDVLEQWTPNGRKAMAFNIAFFETIEGFESGAVRVNGMAIGVSMPTAPESDGEPYFKLTLSARAAVSDWAGALAFFDTAKGKVHDLVSNLTSARVNAKWV